MTIRSKSVDKAFKLMADEIDAADRCISNPYIAREIKNIYSLKKDVLLSAKMGFDEFLTNADKDFLRRTKVKDLFAHYMKLEIKEFQSGVANSSSIVCWNVYYIFKIKLFDALLEKYRKPSHRID